MNRERTIGLDGLENGSEEITPKYREERMEIIKVKSI